MQMDSSLIGQPRNWYENFTSTWRSMAHVLGLSKLKDLIQGTYSLMDQPAWLLGTWYGVADGDAESSSLPPELESALVTDFGCRIWFTYRRGFPPIAGSGLTTDAGWGCTLRTGQMLLAEAVLRHRLGRRLSAPAEDGAGDALCKVLELFLDGPGPAHPFSLHSLCATGQPYGVVPGQWLGPWILCKTVAAAVAAGPDLGLRVHVVADPAGGAPVLLVHRVQEVFARQAAVGTQAPTEAQEQRQPLQQEQQKQQQQAEGCGAHARSLAHSTTAGSGAAAVEDATEPASAQQHTQSQSCQQVQEQVQEQPQQEQQQQWQEVAPGAANAVAVSVAEHPLQAAGGTAGDDQVHEEAGVEQVHDETAWHQVLPNGSTAPVAGAQEEQQQHTQQCMAPQHQQPDCALQQQQQQQQPCQQPPLQQADVRPPAVEWPNQEGSPCGLLLLVPVTLGVGRVNERYLTQLQQVLTFPQSVGIVGGRPASSLYFVGWQGANIMYLDPHEVQQAATLPADLPTFFCCTPRLMTLAAIDPSLAVGFYCQSLADFQDLCQRLQQLQEQAGTTPLLTLAWTDPLPADGPLHPAAAGSREGSGSRDQQEAQGAAGLAAAAAVAATADGVGEDFEQIPSSSGEGWTLL